MTLVSRLGLAAVGLSALAPSVGGQQPAPPIAKIVPKMDTTHGDVRVDNYFWMKEKSNPDVTAYLEAENRYAEAAMRHTDLLQLKLYQEMLGRIKETDLSVPYRLGDYFYYTRTEQGKQYPIYCRKRGTLAGREEVLLDQNELAKGRSYFSVGVFLPSPNQQLLAYSVDTAGNESYTLYVKDLRTGQLLADRVPNTYYAVEWANDDRTLFYTTLDEAMRPYKLLRHSLGTDAARDSLIYHEPDVMFFVGVSKTKDREYLLFELGSITTSEVRYLDADTPRGQFRVVHPRQHLMEYSVEHHGTDFFIVTNDSARNFRLMRAPVADPSKRTWKTVLPDRDSVRLDGIDVFRDHLVAYERANGLRRIRVIDLASGNSHFIGFQEPAYTVRGGQNPEFDTRVVRFVYTSLVTPSSVYDYDMATRSRELKKRTDVLGGYDASRYKSERIFARAPDGAIVPISIMYRQPLTRDGTRPLYLTGYGAYGSSRDPAFNSNVLSLVDRGFIYGVAHIRGGEEMGRTWYEQGKLLNKKNTFTDFIAAAEHMVRERYTSSDRLAIQGGSAGGLLMGAVTNMRPELFKVVIAKVPFVDVITTMKDASIPLTATEWEEWGNPNDPRFYTYMKSYSPYDNVERKAYPHLLITAGLNDPRVLYVEPAKWAARLRALKTDNNRLLLKTNMGAGHGGSSGRYDYLREIAFDYAFILDAMGLGEVTTSGRN